MQVKPEARTFPIPSTPGGCADRMYALDQKRNALINQANQLEEEYNYIAKYVLEVVLPNNALQGVIGKRASISKEMSDQANVHDWDKVHAYVIKNRAWDLMRKQLNITACRERWAAKKVIPGVSIFTVTKLKLTPRKGEKK